MRFIDHSARIDVVSFKSKFTNYSSAVEPAFFLQIYESDSENGPWMKSESSSNSTGVFLFNSKPYIKIELQIIYEEENVDELGLLLFINVLIHDPISPVVTDSVRSILSNFPTWTAIYEDSIEKATPELATPVSVGAKFLNSLVSDYLDLFDAKLDLNSINSFISTADEDEIDWLYISYNVPASAMQILGDDISLARSSSLNDFYLSKKDDFIYFHNLSDNQIMTLKKFENLTIDGQTYDQEPLLFFNTFDEFGTRVGLKRLYLENNTNYKKRILDVYQNIPSADTEGLKRTLRRELDIWRAFGSTPDSNYFGATPEVLEILDLESSTPYVSFDNVPQKNFIEFVKFLNENYPSTFGYIKWEDGIWDTAGLNYEGINTVPFIHDTEKATGDYFQPGVGDLDDALVVIENESYATVSFEGYFKADGFKVTSYDDVYAPIKIAYEYFGHYSFDNVPNPDANNPSASTPSANGGVNLVYEIALKAHNQYSTPSVFYKNFSYQDREDFIVKNFYSQNSPASPEFNLIKIFNSDGLSDPAIEFFEKTYGYTYLNTDATPANSSMDLADASTIKVVANARWNILTQQYENVTNANYRVAFNEHTSGYQVNPSFGTEFSIASPNINYINSNFKIGSTVYGTKTISGYTDVIDSELYINSDNDISVIDDKLIPLDNFKDTIVYPIGSTPQNLIIRNVKVYPSPLYNTLQTQELKDLQYGGYSENPYNSGLEYFIPSSPNILIETYSSVDGSGSPTSSNYFETSTINYSSNANSVVITTGLSATPYYPFKKPVWSIIGENELKSTPMIFGYLDRFGNAYKSDEQIENSGRSPNPNNVDSFIDKYVLSSKSFGITSQEIEDEKYIITNINPISSTEEIVLSSSKTSIKSNTFSPDTLIDVIYQDNEIVDGQVQYTYSPISVDAKSVNIFNNKTINIFDTQQPSLKTGWLYLPNEEYYIYAKPILDVYNGQFFELNTTEVPMQGAPVIVTVFDNGKIVNYEELFFNDSSTPGNATFYNEETLYGSDDKSLYLAYPNISNIQIYVEDMFNGRVLINDPLNPEFWVWSFVDQDGNYILDLNDNGQYYLSFLTYIQSGDDIYYLAGNRFQILNSITQQSEIIPGREYKIRYKVDDAFYVERNEKKIYLSSTPSEPSIYHVTYESSEYLSSTPSGLSINSIDNPLDEGFIYATDETYEFDTASVWISPYKISKEEDDLIYVSIISYDINKNPKPNQTFRIYGDYITAEQEYLTTNENGFGKTIIRYTGLSPNTTLLLTVSGISYPDPLENANINSSSGSFSEQYSITLMENKVADYTLKAVSDKIKIKANATDEVNIKGYIRDSDNQAHGTPIIYWRKARTAYEAINSVAYSTNSSTPDRYGTSGYVTADENGNFIIGPFYSQERTDPGLWFVAVDTELASTPSATPVTIYGDVVYWFENYDNIHYSNEPLPLPRFYSSAPLTGDEIISQPAFTYRYYDMEFDATPSATPDLNWTPPKWFQISRYDQYQMGLLGSTPNIVSNYTNLYPDYEDN